MSLAESLRVALLGCLFALATAGLGHADSGGEKRHFNVPRSLAVISLKQTAIQGSIEIFFTDAVVKGVVTPRIRGNYRPQEALELLLADTPLEAVQDSESGAFAIVRRKEGRDEDAAISSERRDSTTKTKRNKSEVNTKKNFFAALRAALTAAVVGGGAQSIGQDDEGESIYELSPFSVSADGDEGYRAASTLAGSRIRTNLGDVATSISVITREFLEDTGATNSEDLLVYTTGTEVVGLGGNYSGGVNVGSGGVPSTGLNGPLTQTRVRGLAGADRTRNYFSSLIEFDSYNTERIEINRGANAALFGLGSPAGIINNSLKQASFANSNEAEFRIGSFGSARASFDVNRELVENTFAVRFAALRNDREYEQDGAFSEDTRFFATATYQKDFSESSDAWGLTKLKINYEDVSWDENRPRIFPLNDGITQWFDPFDGTDFPESIFDPSAPEGAINGVKPVWDGSTMGTGSNTAEFGGARRSSLWVINPVYRHPIVSYESATASDPTSPPGGVIGRQGIISGLPSVPGTGLFVAPNGLKNAMRFTGNPDNGFYANPVVTDFSIFDFRNKLIDGPTKGESTDFDAFNISLEQLFLDNKAGIELAFDKQERQFNASRRLRGGAQRGELHIDPNVTLMDGTPNPNFGRAFVADEGLVIDEVAEVESFRVTGFVEHNFAENSDSWFGRLLGRHVLTGLFDSRESSRSRWEGVPLTVNDDWAGIYGNTNSRLNSNGRKVVSIHYLGDSLANQTSASGANLPAIQALQVPTADLINGGQFRLNDFRSGEFGNVQLTADNRINVQPNATRKTLDEVDSQALILQSFLWDDILIGTVSWREDEVTAFNAGTAPVDPNDPTRFLIDDDVYSARMDSDPYREKGDAVSYGAVLKAPQSWIDQIDGLDGISLHYNESENFQPVGARQTIFGDPLPSPRGETQDYGFSIDLFQRKMSLRLTRYETTQSGINFGGITNGQTIVFEHGRVMNVTLLGVNSNLDSDPFPEIDTNDDGIADIEYVAPPQELLDAFNYSFDPVNGANTGGNNLIRNTQDFIAKGTEIEAILNPTPSWRVMFNAAKQETVVGNTAKPIIDFLNDPTVMTLGDGSQTSILDAWGDPNKLGAFYNVESQVNQLSDIAGTINNQINFAQSQDGLVSQELREWRVNVVTNYQFLEGRMRGVNVGGAYRWQDAPAIGYQLRTGGDGARLLDIASPIFGDSDTKVDAWIGYEKSLRNNSVDWKIQINLRNVLDEGALVPVTANPNGTIPVYSLANGRTWELTNTFRF